jgi:hypothetical protein
MQGKRTLQAGVLLAVAAALTFLGVAMPGGGGVVRHERVPEFRDWSTRHVVYSNWGYFADVNKASADPRAIFSWRERPESMRYRFPPTHPIPRPLPRPHPVASTLQRDWSIYLGTAGTAPSMYPAKYSFDVTQAPSCANDYVVFPIAAKGSGTQPNLVAFNQLYSGTVGANGICNRTASSSDLGTTAEVYWSYNVQGITGGGAVPTSPVISFDPNNTSNTGTAIAFVESISGSAAHFHVLAFKAGDGVVATNLQNVLVPKTISSFTANAPVAGSGTATDLSLGSSKTGTVTLSSPFVDYVRDVAYVGNDVGILYRVKDVFCTSVNPDCKGGSKPAPSLDASWGTGGAVTVCSGVLTGPVLDFVTLNVYVGCSDGKLYSVSQTGTVKSLVVGDGTASKTYGAIVDPPVVDGVNGFVYAVSGSGNAGANGVLVQAKMDLSSPLVAQIGDGNQCNMHAPVFNNIYYTSPTTAGALIYVAGVAGAVSQPCSVSSTTTATTGDIHIYGVGFGAGGGMTAGVPANSLDAGGGPGAEWAPLLEFYNATTSTDWLFVAALQSNQTNMATVNITSSAFGAFANFVEYGLGPSGMIVDNNSASAQAASIYFNAQGENAGCSNNTNPSVLTDTGGCAVKLTQSGLE